LNSLRVSTHSNYDLLTLNHLIQNSSTNHDLILLQTLIHNPRFSFWFILPQSGVDKEISKGLPTHCARCITTKI
jgi:hypothetical protein